MKPVRTLLVLAVAATAVVGCTAYDSYYVPQSQAAYYPAPTVYYSTPAYSTPAYVSYPATAYYAYDPPNYQKSNVYSSRWDYYRNYQGIHGGPERTGP